MNHDRDLRQEDLVSEQLDLIGVTGLVDETLISPDEVTNGHHEEDEAEEEEGEDDDVTGRPLKRRRPNFPSAGSKRRRLDLPSVWNKLSGHVASLKTSPEVAPWLQILDDLLKQYASSFMEQVGWYVATSLHFYLSPPMW